MKYFNVPLSMTRSDLVEKLAARFAQLTHRDAESAVNAILDAMNDALVRGYRIEIRGFGSFCINLRQSRIGRNPRSGESVAIPEKRVLRFKSGKALREEMDKHTVALKRQAESFEVKVPNFTTRNAMAEISESQGEVTQ